MATKTKQWADGSSATIQYDGQGDGHIIITSDPNNHYEARSMQITVETTNGSPKQTKTITINQVAKQRIDLSAAVVTAATQTYSGSAKTPTPTVTLNGSTVPSSGYDVAYSNNTNAGTATITVTGKGDYTGVAYGTFTIAQATGQVTTAPTARDVTYTGSSQYLVTSGSGTGTMYYRYKLSTSSSWSSWSTTRPSRTDAGTYNIEYYAAASSNGNYTQSATGSLNVEMKKAASSVSTAPTAKSLTYTGSAQNLVNAGTASGGTMYYKYTTTNSKPTSTSGFSSSIPTRTTAGTYYVWYYVYGDSNHTSTSISSTAVSVTIAKKSRTMSWSSYPSSLYVGRTGTLSATASAGSSDGTISYSSSSSSKASVSGSIVTAVASGTCTIYASISEGTNYMSASTSYTLTVKAIPTGCVDMGVSVFWADRNIGASSPYDYGDYFSWGNTDGHQQSGNSFGTYSFGTSNSTEPYVSSNGAALTGNVPLSQDAARQNLGSPWRTPSTQDYYELFNNCRFIDAFGNTVTTNDKRVTVNGVVGIYLESPITGNRLFIPCGGYGNGSTLIRGNFLGCYWTINQYTSARGERMYISENYVTHSSAMDKFYGGNIRAIQTA